MIISLWLQKLALKLHYLEVQTVSLLRKLLLVPQQVIIPTQLAIVPIQLIIVLAALIQRKMVRTAQTVQIVQIQHNRQVKPKLVVN